MGGDWQKWSQGKRIRSGCRPTTWFFSSGVGLFPGVTLEDLGREAKVKGQYLFPDSGGLRDSGPGTHPSVEAVTRATLLASGPRRAIPELAFRTDSHAGAQQFSSSLACCMASGP